MAEDMVTVIQLCGNCKTELGSFSVKKENLMLTTQSTIWCPTCQADTQEARDVAGRLATIQKEVESHPKPDFS